MPLEIKAYNFSNCMYTSFSQLEDKFNKRNMKVRERKTDKPKRCAVVTTTTKNVTVIMRRRMVPTSTSHHQTSTNTNTTATQNTSNRKGP